MNYNGDVSFRRRGDIWDNRSWFLDYQDKAGEDKPWESRMPADGDDSDKFYFTDWDTCKKF